ncbi:MAG: hypothetical protein V7L22_23425 [Nostoc sp.]|uniref:hypothetical protein n=1 Tax=Nostoc sp. TaxID=1180 RepID=UPI002FF4B107
MSIVRTKKKKNNFSIIDNTGLVDPTLTWKETGLLSFLMTKPDDWEISIKALSHNKVDGRDSVATAITGLRKKGYIHRIDKRVEGRFETEYLVFETREDLREWLEENEMLITEPERLNRDGSTGTAQPERLNRDGLTVTENPSQLNTDIDITEELNTEKLNTEREEEPHAQENFTDVEREVETLAHSPEQAHILREVFQAEDSVQRTSLQETTLSETQTPTHPVQVLPSSKIILRGENDSHKKTVDRIKCVWEQTGILPKIPMEIELWASADLGQDVLSAYRLSGRITTTKRGDIAPEFAMYVSSQNRGKDIDYGYTYIKKLEADPRQWETLASLVLKWQASIKAGDRDLNIARTVDRASRPSIKINLNL